MIQHPSAATTDDDAHLAASIAEEAGRLLLRLRAEAHAEVGADPKALGRRGDLCSNELILARLAEARPDDAVLSEESADDPVRVGAPRVWIVDPLDGTREYGLPDRPDWAVHVALWEAGRGITAAAVAQPSLGAVYTTSSPIAPTAHIATPLRLLVSDSRPPAFMHDLCEEVIAEAHPMGSAGAKAMAVLRGEFDGYVHAGGQYEWDSAAPVGVALAAGLYASRLDGNPLVYNSADPYLPDLVICRAEIADRLLNGLRAVGAGDS